MQAALDAVEAADAAKQVRMIEEQLVYFLQMISHYKPHLAKKGKAKGKAWKNVVDATLSSHLFAQVEMTTTPKAAKVKSLRAHHVANYGYAPGSPLPPSRTDDAVLAKGASVHAKSGSDEDPPAGEGTPMENIDAAVRVVRKKPRRSSSASSASPFSPKEEDGFATFQKVSSLWL